MCACSVTSVVSDFVTPWLLCPWDSPGKNAGVGCHSLFQGIFPTQGCNPRLPMSPVLQVDSLPLSPSGSPIFSISKGKRIFLLITYSYCALTSIAVVVWVGISFLLSVFVTLLIKGIHPQTFINDFLLHGKAIITEKNVFLFSIEAFSSSTTVTIFVYWNKLNPLCPCCMILKSSFLGQCLLPSGLLYHALHLLDPTVLSLYLFITFISTCFLNLVLFALYRNSFVFVLYTLDISGRNWGAFPPIHSFTQFADLTVTNQKKILTCLNWFASVCWLLLDVSPLYLHCCCSVAQSCPTFCDPMDCSPPGSSVYGIFQARILEWAAISFSRGSSWPRDRTLITCIAGRFFTAEPQGKPLVPSPNLLLPHNIWTKEPSTNQHQRENTNKTVTQKPEMY